MKQDNKNKMNAKNFDIVMYTNADGLGTDCVSHAHRLPFIKGIAKAMEGIGKVLVVLQYRSIPQCWFDNNEKSRKTSLTTSGPNQLDENLWTIRPTVIGNLVLASYLKPVKWNLLRQQRKNINRAAVLLNMNNKRIAWMTHPYHYLYRGCAQESAIVYECYDEFVFSSSGKRSKRTELVELELARNAHLNIATAKTLFDKLVAFNKNAKLISNGVMYDLFSKCRDSQMHIAPELKILASPVIGMIGTLYRGYDFNLLNCLIEKREQWSFVFVGEIAENAKDEVKKLSKHSNFHIFGWRSYEELPAFLKGFDVAIIPYQVNDWTNTINPNKVYDYFAAGVPVVATPIDELRKLKECLTLCQNKDEFIKAIESVIRGESKDKMQRGAHIAGTLSWNLIASEAIGELTKLIGNKL